MGINRTMSLERAIRRRKSVAPIDHQQFQSEVRLAYATAQALAAQQDYIRRSFPAFFRRLEESFDLTGNGVVSELWPELMKRQQRLDMHVALKTAREARVSIGLGTSKRPEITEWYMKLGAAEKAQLAYVSKPANDDERTQRRREAMARKKGTAKHHTVDGSHD